MRDITARGKGPQTTLKKDLSARSLATKDGDSVSAMSSTWRSRAVLVRKLTRFHRNIYASTKPRTPHKGEDDSCRAGRF